MHISCCWNTSVYSLKATCMYIMHGVYHTSDNGYVPFLMLYTLPQDINGNVPFLINVIYLTYKQ